MESIYNFLENGFYKETEKYKSFKSKNTGFKKLDESLNGVNPALYLIGAESSLGKTTFILQIADYMARQGEHVLFFSLEQSTMELVSKNLSRIAISDFEEKLNTGHFLYNTDKDFTEKVISKYKEYAKNITIIEGNFKTTVNSIKDFINKYIESHGKEVKPVVFVDYLQVIQSLEYKFSDKQKIDNNITELKRISRDLFIPVFVVSSLNRGNYLTPISYEAFKESGAIEYTADILIGLQYQAIHEVQNKQGSKKQDIEIMNKAKLENPRKIELSCLKNRGGQQTFTINYKYYPANNYFCEDESIF